MVKKIAKQDAYYKAKLDRRWNELPDEFAAVEIFENRVKFKILEDTPNNRKRYIEAFEKAYKRFKKERV